MLLEGIRVKMKKKGGEKNEKERSTLVEPVAVCHAVRRRDDSAGVGRWGNPQGS
jgi:hypothetical protein